MEHGQAVELQEEQRVVVYSKPSCVQCTATYRALDAADIPYDVVDISTDVVARQYAMSLGHLRVPVVVTPAGQHWSGYRPDNIRALYVESPSLQSVSDAQVREADLAARVRALANEQTAPTGGVDPPAVYRTGPRQSIA